MSAVEFSDEDLMAYADGELADDRAEALDLALAGDAAPAQRLAQRLALFVDTRGLAAEALRPMLDEPVPDHLVQRVRDLAVTAQPARTVVAFPARPAVRPLWHLPVAASVALAVGLGAGLMLRGPDAPGGPVSLALATDPETAQVLTTLASGNAATLTDGTRIVAVSTFRAADNALCREYEVTGATEAAFVSVACHDGQAWQMRLAVATSLRDDGAYVPAGSLETLDAYLVATAAGAPLAEDQEAAALAALSR